MNKLLYVNIGGSVFQIDENAYNTLDVYLNTIRKKYTNTAGGDEIIADIENRIAELFYERVGEKGAITQEHVDAIISVMGNPEEYDTTADENTPAAAEEQSYRRSARFYRDGEHRVLGGVCSGFAAHFDVDALWIRIAFLVSFFFFGTGLLLYLILWIIIPEAKTTAEKIEMHGSRVNISNIEKTVKEEATHFKGRIKDFGEEVKQTFSKKNTEHVRTSLGKFAEDFVHALRPVLKGIAKAIVLIVVIICFCILIATGIELIGDSQEDIGQIHFLNEHVIANATQTWLLVCCGLALVIIPLMAIVFGGIKFIMNVKRKFRMLASVFTFLWFACLFTVMYIAIKLVFQFKYEAGVSNAVNIEQPTAQVLYVQVNSLPEENIIWHRNYQEDWGQLFMNDTSVLFKNIHLQIERSADSMYSVIITKNARGSSNENAKIHAQNFQYEIAQNDTLIQIPSSVILKKNELWRSQEIDILIRVPQNKFILLDSKLQPMLNDNEYISTLQNDDRYGKKLLMTQGGLIPAR